MEGGGDKNEPEANGVPGGPVKRRRSMDEGEGTSVSINKSNIVSLLKLVNYSPSDRIRILHNISLDNTFRITRAPESVLERMIRENVHRAFWDLLQQDMTKIPPEVKNAISLLLEAKSILLEDLVSKKDTKRRSEIAATLDENTLRNQIEQGTFDVKGISQFLINIISGICAPIRDEEVAAVKEKTGDTVEMLKGLMKLLDSMKEDLISFFLENNREEVVKAAREYEREDMQTAMESMDALKESINKSIREAYESVKEEEDVLNETLKRKVAVNYLLSTLQEPSPSATLSLWSIDVPLILGLSDKLLQLVLVSSCLSLIQSHSQLSNEDQTALCNRLILISNDAEEENISQVVVSMKEECNRFVSEKGLEVEKAQLEVMNELSRKDQSIRVLFEQRVASFISSRLSSLSSPPPLPNSLTPVSSFLNVIIDKLLIILTHNLSTYSDIYESTISPLLSCSS